MAINDAVRLISNKMVGGSITSILSQQHIRAQALSIASQQLLQFKFGLLGLPSAPEYIPPSVFVAGVPVTTRIQEVYSYDSEATQFPVESGSLVSDHVILRPIRIESTFELSNWVAGQAEYSLSLLEQMWETRVLLDLQTEHKTLNNMVLVGLQAENSAPFWGKLAFKATFQNIPFVTLESVQIEKEKVAPVEGKTGGPDNSKSAESPVSSTSSTTTYTTQSKSIGVLLLPPNSGPVPGNTYNVPTGGTF